MAYKVYQESGFIVIEDSVSVSAFQRRIKSSALSTNVDTKGTISISDAGLRFTVVLGAFGDIVKSDDSVPSDLADALSYLSQTATVPEFAYSSASLDVSTLIATQDISLGLIDFSKLSIQIDSVALTGTLDGTIAVIQRNDASASWGIADAALTVTLDAANATDFIETASWLGAELGIRVTKNLLTAGTLNIFVSAK